MNQANLRQYNLDHIKLFLTILVIFHHMSVSFGAIGDWYYKLPLPGIGQQKLLILFNSVNQSFFMGLFFFISASFVPSSLEKKGVKKFLLDRFLRLAVPLLAFCFFLNPLFIYSISWWESVGTAPKFHYIVEPGPLWFVAALLIFSFVSAFLHGVDFFHLKNIQFPSTVQVLLFCLLMSSLTFLVRFWFPVGKTIFSFQLGYFPMYVALYFLGKISASSQWLKNLHRVSVYFWGFIVLFLILGWSYFVDKVIMESKLSDVLGGWNRYSLIYSLWEPLICVGIIFLLLILFSKYFHKKLAYTYPWVKASYSAYIIHPFFCVWSLLILKKLFAFLNFPHIVNFFIAGTISVLASFAMGNIMRKIPILNNIL